MASFEAARILQDTSTIQWSSHSKKLFSHHLMEQKWYSCKYRQEFLHIAGSPSAERQIDVPWSMRLWGWVNPSSLTGQQSIHISGMLNYMEKNSKAIVRVVHLCSCWGVYIHNQGHMDFPSPLYLFPAIASICLFFPKSGLRGRNYWQNRLTIDRKTAALVLWLTSLCSSKISPSSVPRGHIKEFIHYQFVSWRH